MGRGNGIKANKGKPQTRAQKMRDESEKELKKTPELGTPNNSGVDAFRLSSVQSRKKETKQEDNIWEGQLKEHRDLQDKKEKVLGKINELTRTKGIEKEEAIALLSHDEQAIYKLIKEDIAANAEIYFAEEEYEAKINPF